MKSPVPTLNHLPVDEDLATSELGRSLMLIRGKALNLSIYTAHNGPDDVEWLRNATLRWVEELQRLNTR